MTAFQKHVLYRQHRKLFHSRERLVMEHSKWRASVGLTDPLIIEGGGRNAPMSRKEFWVHTAH